MFKGFKDLPAVLLKVWDESVEGQKSCIKKRVCLWNSETTAEILQKYKNEYLANYDNFILILSKLKKL